ncbi:ATP12 family chaperone protein [Roseovarius nitratireducens]|uniref:ATP12 family chaperone protein n=1 Tax=Roseovarius nitratireducens TaxID=2044597 RepID=UPI000CE16518|nr:ATP12 family protein [Roseovarius nitratireducens]
MSEWAAKRFWNAAEVVEAGGGFGVRLDGRAVRTPAKAELVVPTQALAREIAAEWDAQEGEIVPATMPLTRAANAAIDRVAREQAEVAAMLAEYGSSDLLCYRAESPAELVARQAEAWDPLLDWAESAFSVRLRTTSGVMHVTQDAAALERLHAEVRLLDIWALTAFHDLVCLSGSLVIGLAALRDQAPLEALWRASRIDESWQQEQWGSDEEAEAVARKKECDFFNAKRFHDLSRPLWAR